MIKDIVPGDILYDDVVVLGLVCLDKKNIANRNYYILNNISLKLPRTATKTSS